jgi:Holliday junction DNA helicase RuvA
MIASLRGRVIGADADGLVVEVGGVGLRVHATSAARTMADAAPDDVSLITHLVVREDALSLYGFASADERELFLALLGVSGVGPKVALSILSAYPAPSVRAAIAAGDDALFTAVPGIGKKLAARLVVELRDRVGSVPTAASPGAGSASPVAADDDRLAARAALVGLGYSVAEAEAALAGTSGDPEGRVRAALGALA